jgi:antibiotic biosynthesis monooxygenase (ABM) superfamily enzyme
MIRVAIMRHCKPGQENRLEGLLKDLRASCMRHPGYISGETLVNMNDPTTYLVIGTWTRLEAWKAWENCQERQELLQIVSSCLLDEPVVEVYTFAGEEPGNTEYNIPASSIMNYQ